MSHEPLPVPPNIPQIMAALFKEVEFKILGGVDAVRVAEAAYYEHLWREEAEKESECEVSHRFASLSSWHKHIQELTSNAELCAARCRALSAPQMPPRT